MVNERMHTAETWAAEFGDGDEDFDSGCEVCGELFSCFCEEAAACKCGAYYFDKNGVARSFGDCYCG